MSINYKSDSILVSRPKPPLMLLLLFVNAAFSLAILAAWTQLAGLIAVPVAWATWSRIYRTGDMGDILEYPFSVLWMMPLLFVGLAWSAEKLGARSVAWMCCTVPVFINIMMIGWFYLAPPEWK